MITRRSVLLTAAAATVTTKARAAAKTIRLGHIADESGVFKGVAGPGVVAADMAVAHINKAGGVNGMPIELVRYDPGSDPRQAAIAARKLIEDDKVLAVVGPFSSGETLVAMNDAERAQCTMVPIAASQAGLLDGKKFTWRLAVDEGVQFTRVLASMKNKGILPKTVQTVYISEEPVSNASATKTWPPILDSFGIKSATPIGFQYKSFDVAPQIAKAIENNPDAVAVAGLPESAAKVVHELKRQNYKGHMIGSQLFADRNIIDLFGNDGDGTIFAAGFYKDASPEAAAFDKEFLEGCKAKGIFKLGAFQTDAITYDLIYLLSDAIRKAKLTADPDKLVAERIALNDALRGITFSGVLGKNICFKGQDGQMPGYVIDMEHDAWTLFEAWPAASCA
jgi:branched-chain amino acid transport system substrate-binding protein